MTIYEKLDGFSDYTFHEADHSYWLGGERVKTSVTQLVGTFTEEFDKEYWSQKKAKDRNVTPDVILKEWEDKAEFAGTCGTQFHSYLENILAGKLINPFIEGRDDVNERLEKLMPLAERFEEDIRHKMIPIRSECIVGKGLEVAGQFDQLFYNSTYNELQVWDWKTSKSIDEYNPFRKFMKNPFSHLFDCNFYTYSLQLNIYRHLLALKGISVARCYIAWFHEKNDSYKIYEAFDMSETVAQIL